MGLERSKFAAQAISKAQEPLLPQWMDGYQRSTMLEIIQEIKHTKNFAAIWFLKEPTRTYALQYCLHNGFKHAPCVFIFDPQTRYDAAKLKAVTGKIIIDGRTVAPQKGQNIECRVDESPLIWQRWGQKGWLSLPPEKTEEEDTEPEPQPVEQPEPQIEKKIKAKSR